jgi:hypothetical protein
MSLLLEALKKAENKEEAQRRTRAESGEPAAAAGPLCGRAHPRRTKPRKKPSV